MLFNKIKSLHTGLMGDFLACLYATLMGVLLSLFAADQISDYYERREMKTMMMLLVDELEFNTLKVHKMCDRVLLEKRACRYLYNNRDNMDSVPKDSLDLYGGMQFSSLVLNFTTDAMETLKASGLITKVSDRKLTFDIIKAYGSLNELNISYRKYLDYKSYLKNTALGGLGENDVEEFTASNWKSLVKKKYGLNVLRRLPNYQSSSLYINKIKQLESAIEGIKRSYDLE